MPDSACSILSHAQHTLHLKCQTQCAQHNACSTNARCTQHNVCNAMHTAQCMQHDAQTCQTRCTHHRHAAQCNMLHICNAMHTAQRMHNTHCTNARHSQTSTNANNASTRFEAPGFGGYAVLLVPFPVVWALRSGSLIRDC